MRYAYIIPKNTACVSEYTGQINKFDGVFSIAGFVLESDGWKNALNWDCDFAKDLPVIALTNQQTYYPVLSIERFYRETFFSSANDFDTVVDDFILFAKLRSDWDNVAGFVLDFEGIVSKHKNKLTELYSVFYEKLKEENKEIFIHARAINADYGEDYDDAYANDLTKIGNYCDKLIYQFYCYWQPAPRSIAPLWWVQSCTDYITKFMCIDKIVFCHGLFSTKRTVDMGSPTEITYTQAISECENFELIESPIYEKYGQVGEVMYWLHDIDTFRIEHHLTKKLGYSSWCLFFPGYGDSRIYSVFGDDTWHGYIRVDCTGIDVDEVINKISKMTCLHNNQPELICHYRKAGNFLFIEGVFLVSDLSNGFGYETIVYNGDYLQSQAAARAAATTM